MHAAGYTRSRGMHTSIILSGTPQDPIPPESVNDMLVGVLGAVIAWGLIDGTIYALLSMFERGERYRLLKDIQAACTEQEAVNIIAEDLDYMLKPITGENERIGTLPEDFNLSAEQQAAQYRLYAILLEDKPRN